MPPDVGVSFERTDMLAVFTGYDWAIVIVTVLVASLPGFLVRRYIRQQSDFLVAGRTLSVFLAAATLTATEMGLITVMYFAEQGFLNGFSAFAIGLIAFVTTLFVGLSGFMISGLRASGVTTFAEYYERRYNRGVRLLGGLVLAVAGILNYGVFLRVEAEFVRIITGIPDMQLKALDGAWTVSVPALEVVMTVLVLVVLTYTLLGGMVSVVITDYLQFIVLTTGMAVTTWFVLTDTGAGGITGMAAAVAEHRPGYGLNPFMTGHAGRTILGLGGIFLAWQVMHWTATSCWQTQAFRTAAVDSPRTARAMWSITAVNYFGRAVIPMLWGVAALAWLAHSGADIATANSQTAMPQYISAILPAGVVGLLLAGMLAALMSTHSGYLLAWSGVLAEDLVAPFAALFGLRIGDRTRLWMTRAFILLLGAYLLVFGLWYSVKSSIWNFLAVTGTMYFAGAATLLAFGLYWRRANIGGAYAALIAGAAPGVVYLTAHITSLIVEPAIAQRGHEPVSAIARFSGHLTEPVIGVISYPLGVAGMIVGSLLYARWRRPPHEPACVPTEPGGPQPSVSAAAEPEEAP
jgi:SSS family solute:Na+ symporter